MPGSMLVSARWRLAFCASVLTIGVLSFSKRGDAQPAVTQESNSVKVANAAAPYGAYQGEILLDGEPPVLPPTLKKGHGGKAAVECNSQDILDETLVVDSKTRGIKNVFVYVLKAPAIPQDLPKDSLTEVTVKAEGCRFVPHAVIVRTYQTIKFETVDSVGSARHNLHPFPMRNPPYGRALSPTDSPMKEIFKVSERLPMRVACDIHPWMKGYWLILDHPYAALTDQSGHFKIEKLPAGNYQFQFWHEKAGHLEKDLHVAIKSNQTTDQGTRKYKLGRFTPNQ